MGKLNNPNAAKNLIPPKKGERRNPNGRPKKIPEIDVLLGEVLSKLDSKGISEAQLILERLAKDAKGGNTRAAEVLLDRAYGKPKQHTDITTDGQPIETRVIISGELLKPNE